jgi:PAS domain S-box-containing protein
VAHRPFDESPPVSVLVPGAGRDERLEHAAERFAEFSADLLAITGFDGRVKWVNTAHEELLGYAMKELVGKPYLDFLHPDDRERAAAEGTRMAGTRNGSTSSFEIRLRTREGRHRWFLFSATPSPDEELVYSVGKDVTERRWAEEELALAHELALAIGQAETAERALEATVRRVCERTGWALGQVWLPNAEGRLVCGSAWHASSSELESFRRLSEAFVFPAGIGIPGRALGTREPVWVKDLDGTDEVSRAPFAKQAGLHAALAVPVLADEDVVAVLEFFVAEPGEHDEALVALVSAVARQLGAVMRHRQAECALRRSERHFSAVARSAAEAIVSIDADGKVTFFNDAAERVFGYDAGEMTGAAASLILPGLDDDAAVHEQLAGSRVELLGRRRGEIDIPLEATFSKWEADGSVFVTAVLRDITENRRTADAMHEAEERFQSAFEEAPIGIALVSIEADRAGCFLRVNRAVSDITGYAHSDLIGLPLGEVVDLDGTDDSDRRYVPWMLAGEHSSYEAETRMRRADDRVLDALLNVSLVRDARDRPLYLIVQLQDVTARKEAERKLKETSERMQAILDNSTAVVYLKDTDGRYLLVNREFEALFDVTRDEAIGREDRDLFAPEAAELLRANDLRVLREQIPLEMEEAVPVGDRTRTYLSIKFPLLDTARRPYAVCGISTDITERKHAEEAVRASEQHFREIVNTTHEAFVSMDESGRITAWNPEAETTFGWSEDEALGRNLADTIIPARHRGAHNRGIHQFLSSGHAALLNRRLEIEALHRDGHEFPVEMTIAPVRVAGRYAFNAFLHDIGERKQAEQALRRLADIIDASGDAIFATTPSGEITSWNAGAEQLYGYDAREAMGTSVRMLVGPDRPADFDVLARALNGSRLDDYETDQLRKDGTHVPVSLSISPIRGSSGALAGASVIARDRTERKRAEEALREVQEGFRTAFEDAPIGMALFSVDPTADGRLLQVNSSLCDITGYSVDELLRTSLHTVSHPRDQAEELALAEDLLAGRIPNYQLEKRFLRRDGTPVWVMHNVSTVHDPSGRMLYGIAQVQDISERKRAEERLSRVAAELELRAIELERSNADLGQFAYVASHDLSEPLRMVSSYVQLLERRYSDQLDPDAHEFIDFAVDGVNRMQRLIDDLLAYSRVGTSEYRLEPVDLAALVDDTLGGMRATVGESGAIVTKDGLPTVVGDPGQLRQLFQNLIANGIKFVEDGPPRIHVSAQRDGREWHFAVADNGIGIDPNHAERIFAVFKRLHGREAYPGSGIGLSICKRIVERHHGRIWVEQNEGGGSRFCFTIPVSEELEQ